MNYSQLLPSTIRAQFAVGVALAAILTGCAAPTDAPPGQIAFTPNDQPGGPPASQVIVTPATPANVGPSAQVTVASPVFAAQDDYVYYPGYNMYYSSRRHQYAYLEGRDWVSRPDPRGVSVDALRTSPSVRMEFHDSPANHHAEMVKKYPKTWTQERKELRNGEKHD